MSPLADRLSAVTRRLSAIRGSIRRLFALDGLSRLALTIGAFICLTFALDWLFWLPRGVRIFFLVAGLAVIGWILVRRLFYPLSRRISDDDLALFVERTYPQINDRLISAIQLSRAPSRVPDLGAHETAYNSPELVDALVDDAVKSTESLDFGRAVVGRYVGKLAFWGFTVVALLAGAALWNPEGYASIYFNRILGGSTKWPQRTHLHVLDFDAQRRRVAARGDDVTVAVSYQGVTPSKVTLEYTFATGEQGRERMTPAEGDRFMFTFLRLSGPFSFIVTGGDDRTETYHLDTVNPPSVETVNLFYTYPAYLGLENTPADRPETSGSVSVPLRTEVRFEARSNEDLESATLLLGPTGKEEASPLEVAATPEGDPRVVRGAFTVTEPVSAYEIRLLARNGLSNRDPIRFPIKGRPDGAPRIKVTDPLGDEFVTEICARPLVVDVEDDHGVRLIVLKYRVVSQQEDRSKEPQTVEFGRRENTRDYGEEKIHSETVLDIEKLGLQAGDHVEFHFEAHDYKDHPPPNLGKSRDYKLSIVTVGTLEKELQDAIEKIKTVLRDQKTRQETAWSRSSRLIQRFGAVDILTPEQQAEVRQAGLEQNAITSKLESARKDIRYVKRRGVYNKIYDEKAAAQLQSAIDALDGLVGVPGDETREALSRVAAQKIDDAAKLRRGNDRTAFFRDAQADQNVVAAGIQRAIEHLDKWSSYQEVIRITRELKDRQQKELEQIKEAASKPCPHGRPRIGCPECEKRK